MRIRRTVIIAIALFLTGCSSILVSSTPPPVYYQLDYQAVAATCPRHFSNGVRIQPFSASAPFDQPAMVVKQPKNRVSFSNTYQWVANPGILVSQALRRDLGIGNLFPQVVGTDNPSMVPLELTGHIFEFAWVKDGSQARARLDVEVSLVDTGTHQVLLRKTYRLEGASYPAQDADTFARAMNTLMERFSKELQEDLCKAIPSS